MKKVKILLICFLSLLMIGLVIYKQYEPKKIKKELKIEEKKEKEQEPQKEEVKPEETKTEEIQIVYTSAEVNMRDGPTMEARVVNVLNINTELKKVGEINGWGEIRWSDTELYYIYNDYLSSEPVTIVQQTYTPPSNSGVLTKSKGVNYFNGHKETWYSQRVLPGNGLRIPGRHVAEDGTIRDENNYIAVASSDYAWGTVVETSLGMGKVYDSGCDSGIIDIYTDW